MWSVTLYLKCSFSLVLVRTWFLGQICFLSKTASSQPSQQGKDGLDKGISTNSRATLSICVHRWMHQGRGGVTLRREKGHNGDFGLATNLSCFFWDISVFCVVFHKNLLFLPGNEYLGVKISILPLLLTSFDVPLANTMLCHLPPPPPPESINHPRCPSSSHVVSFATRPPWIVSSAPLLLSCRPPPDCFALSVCPSPACLVSSAPFDFFSWEPTTDYFPGWPTLLGRSITCYPKKC